MKVLYYIKKYKKEIATTVCLMLGTSVLNIIAPLVMREAIDYTSSFGIKLDYLLIYCALFIMLYVFKFCYQRYRFWFSEKFKNTETVSLFDRICTMSYEKINELQPTYLVERVQNSVETIYRLFSSSLAGIFISALTMIIILFIVFRIDFLLSVFFFIQIPIQYFGFKKLLNGKESKLSRLSEEKQIISAETSKDIKSILEDVDNIKQFGRKNMLNYIKERVQTASAIDRKANGFAMSICTILDFICGFLMNISNVYVVVLFATGQIQIGDLVYLSLINNIYYNSISDVLDIQINLRDLYGTIKFMEKEIEENQEMDGEVELKEITSISSRLNGFGYKDNILIEKGDFYAEKGDIIAITGESGCGKTSFVKSFLKFIPNDLYINGVLIDSIRNESLREHIFYLSQNTCLLPVTIKENIIFGEDISEERFLDLMSKDFMAKFGENDWDKKRCWKMLRIYREVIVKKLFWLGCF